MNGTARRSLNLICGLVLSVFIPGAAMAAGYSVLHSMSDPEGTYFWGGLALDPEGNVIGTPQDHGALYPNVSCGTVVKLDPQESTFTVLHTLAGPPTDGCINWAPPLIDRSGNAYVITAYGGANDCGTIIRLDPRGNETVLHSFDCNTEGSASGGALIRDSDGNLYGTNTGGANGLGTVFKLDTRNVLTVLHVFAGAPSDGANPSECALTMDEDGNLYGVTHQGGTHDLGTVFKLDALNRVTVLHSFAGYPADGERPNAAQAMPLDSHGNLYGLTGGGGANNLGIIFRLNTRNGRLTVLHSFAGAPSDAAAPFGSGVIRDARGNIYGATEYGGTNDLGAVFKLDTLNRITVLHSFTGPPSDGAYPEASVVMDRAGHLYGTTYSGGANDEGTIYEVKP